MNEATLNQELDKLTHDATGNNSTFIKENEELLNRYEGNPYGDEVAERSKVISNDVMDVVEADMPALARIFLGPSEVIKFKANRTDNKEDVDEAESKTKYVDWQIRHQPWSFPVLFGFIKNAEILKASVVKYFVDETTEVEEHKKTGISNEELAMFQESLEGEDVKSIDIDREEENDDGENTVVVKVERTRKCVKILNVELENFRMTKNVADKNLASLVGDVSRMTRGELLAAGFDRDTISKLDEVGGETPNTSENSNMSEIRDEAEGGTTEENITEYWAGEQVEVEDLYPMIDYDGDGIAERRHIMRSGDTILLNEVFNHVPYAVMSSIMMPHKALGKSRAEITTPTAKVKTAILRGINDNIYAVNSPRIAANTKVEMDDLLVMRPNGVVRTKDDTNPGQNMFAIQVPYIGDKALQVLQYWDQARAQTTGSLLASQGLQADDLGKETATRFEGIEDASDAKTELVARVMVETGFRQLYEGVAWLDSNFQITEIEEQILGKELPVKPSDWKFKHNVVSKVGLGAGDDEKILSTMSALWALHAQLQERNSAMTDEVKRFNILKTMVTASGLPEVEEYFNDPERPEQLITAENEIMRRMVQALEEQNQALQNPLAEAETIKARGMLIKAQSDQQTAIAKLTEDMRQFNITTKQDQDQFNKDLAAKLTELMLKFEQPVPGALTQ